MLVKLEFWTHEGPDKHPEWCNPRTSPYIIRNSPLPNCGIENSESWSFNRDMVTTPAKCHRSICLATFHTAQQPRLYYLKTWPFSRICRKRRTDSFRMLLPLSLMSSSTTLRRDFASKPQISCWNIRTVSHLGEVCSQKLQGLEQPLT
jgi:hypothetical protein